MKILQINTVYGRGSTGKIAQGLHDVCVEKGHQCVSAYRYSEGTFEDTLNVSTWLDCHIHNRLARETLLQGSFSWGRTLLFLRKVKRYAPDVIHLHNLHGSYINFKLLFSYIKRQNIPVVWTFHDCWAFTGQCPYFVIAKCDRWMSGCAGCPSYSARVSFGGDTVKKIWRRKKTLFSDVENLTIVTPSKWLNGLVKQSFLKDKSTEIIYTGIDLNMFKPTDGNFRVRHNIDENRKILLGVSFGWNYRKGLDVFIELAKRLNPSEYQIVLVGTDEAVEEQLPKGILSIRRTSNQKELAEIYTAADLFVNPTREEMFGLVNVEANACGTPVLTFRTGGSPECIDETSGAVVECDDIDAMEREIVRICSENPYSVENCLTRARQFDMNERFEEYVKLYEKIKN